MSADGDSVWYVPSAGNSPTLHAHPECPHLNSARGRTRRNPVKKPAGVYPDYVDRCSHCVGVPLADPLVGDQLRRCREAAGLSQAALADTLGVARDTIANWETGEKGQSPVTAPDVRALFERRGVDPAAYGGEADE